MGILKNVSTKVEFYGTLTDQDQMRMHIQVFSVGYLMKTNEGLELANMFGKIITLVIQLKKNDNY